MSRKTGIALGRILTVALKMKNKIVSCIHICAVFMSGEPEPEQVNHGYAKMMLNCLSTLYKGNDLEFHGYVIEIENVNYHHWFP